MVKLEYQVVDSSGHSSSYHPSNILVESPMDQGSRWSSQSNDQNQFLLLKLDRPALVRTISFGKFFKTHVCNLKEFRVLAGCSAGQMFEVVHSGLRNDSETETFPLSFPDSIDAYCPVQWVKIVPVAAWGSNFNFSIWYVELRGINDLSIVKASNSIYQENKRKAAWRLALKFLQSEPQIPKQMFSDLEAMSGVSLDGPLVQSLYQLIVERGDFSAAEELLVESGGLNGDLFAEYIEDNIPYKAVWEQLESNETPSKRGGHQMCWDAKSRRVYLFGGWDGTQDLADLWYYSVDMNVWVCVSQDVRLYHN